MKYPARVQIVEVGPRDGLQNEPVNVPTAVKLELIDRLQSAGCTAIEVTSFVSPQWVPQMADASEVLQSIRRLPGVRYRVLTPNLRGFETALAGRPDEVLVFAAASETFSQRNINCSIAESIERFRPIMPLAKSAGITVQGVISTAVGCPYEGSIGPDKVGYVSRLMRELGVDSLAVADTTGVGTAPEVERAMEAALAYFDVAQLAGHFHDTHGHALENIRACLQMGIKQFDASCAGLGGCPYAPGASGNVATEAVVSMLEGLGIETGIDLAELTQAGEFITQALGGPAPRHTRRP